MGNDCGIAYLACRIRTSLLFAVNGCGGGSCTCGCA